jgi:ribA/ribD-fused uncharacterized protein
MMNADTTFRDPNDPEIRKDPEGVYFYGGAFSNFAASPFLDGDTGRMYPTVEHWFQANKAVHTEDHEWVRAAPNPAEAKRRGRHIRLRDDWEKVKYDVMLQGLRAKFMLSDFRKALLETGERNIYEDSPYDYEWGFRKGGKNLLGKALMQVRTEIVTPKAEEPDPDPYEGSFREAADNEGARIAATSRGEEE